MIDRIFYKTRAKVNLKGKWIIAALVALVLQLTIGEGAFNFKLGSDKGAEKFNVGGTMMDQGVGFIPFGQSVQFIQTNFGRFAGIFLPLILIVILAGMAFQAFVMAPLSLGAYQYFRQNDLGEERMDISEFLWAFRSSHYLNVVKILFLMNLRIILWSLLLIIPGIIKAYEYSMIPFLLSRNPGMSPQEAFDTSRQLTLGKKSSLFVLDLSFIGWMILGSIPFGLGIPFVTAYESQTKAGIFNDWVGDTVPEYSA